MSFCMGSAQLFVDMLAWLILALLMSSGDCDCHVIAFVASEQLLPLLQL